MPANRPSPRVLAGAGFQGLYNTTCRADRLALQFFVRPGDGEMLLGGVPLAFSE